MGISTTNRVTNIIKNENYEIVNEYYAYRNPDLTEELFYPLPRIEIDEIDEYFAHCKIVVDYKSYACDGHVAYGYRTYHYDNKDGFSFQTDYRDNDRLKYILKLQISNYNSYGYYERSTTLAVQNYSKPPTLEQKEKLLNRYLKNRIKEIKKEEFLIAFKNKI